jgi:hypothetical protein
VHAIGQQPQRVPDGAPVQYERHRPEQSRLYRRVQQHAASCIADIEASTGGELPRFVKDEFDAFLDPQPPPRGRACEAGQGFAAGATP